MANGIGLLASLQCKVDSNNALLVTLDPASTGIVTSVTGTANQITASPTTGAVVLSIPSTFIAPGSIAATTTVSAGTNFLFGSAASNPMFRFSAGEIQATRIDGGDFFDFHAKGGTFSTSIAAINGVFSGAVSGTTGTFTTSLISPAWIPAGGTAAVTGTLTVGGAGNNWASNNITLAAGGQVASTSFTSYATGSVQWVGRALFKSPADAVISLGANAGTTGIRADASVDGTLSIQSFAGADTATVKANKLQITGLPAFVALDKYVTVDSSGNFHISALGPAS